MEVCNLFTSNWKRLKEETYTFLVLSVDSPIDGVFSNKLFRNIFHFWLDVRILSKILASIHFKLFQFH